MKKQLMLLTSLLCYVAASAQIKTSELEVRTPTTSTVNEIQGETAIDGKLSVGNTIPDAPLHILAGNPINYSWSPLTGTSGIFESSHTNRSFLSLVATSNTDIMFGDVASQGAGKIRYLHNNDRMDFWTNGTRRITIDNQGKFGIGTNLPAGKLHVQSSITGGSVNANYDNMIIEQNAANIGVSLLTSNTHNATIVFGDPEDNDAGRVRYHHPDNSMSFFTSSAERMRIANNGWVGIGTTNPIGKFHVRSGNTQGSVSTNYDDIVVEHASGHAGLSFLTMNNRINAITFSDNDATNRGNIYYHHADDRMGFRVSGAERVRILNNGNIGIGTISPAGRLHVFNSATGGSVSSNYDNLIVEQNGANIGMTFLSKNNTNAGIGFSDGDATNRGIILYGHGDDRMAFYTAGAERARILSNGNIGIGTTNPGAKLEIKQSNQQLRLTDSDDNKHWQLSASSKALAFRYQEGAADENLALWLDDAGQMGIGTSNPTSKVTIDEPFSRLTMGAIDGEFRIRSTRLNNHSYSDLVLSAQENVILMPDGGQTAYSGQGKVGIGTDNPIDLLTLQQSGPSGLTFIRSNHDQYRLFLGNSTGLYIRNGSDGRDEMVFDGTGKIGIGTGSPSQKLHVNGNVLANNVSVSSDFRWKKEISPIKEATNTLTSINAVSYRLRKEEFPERDFDEEIHYGVIAQELEKVLPELVNTDNEGYKSVNYLGMIGLLVKGFQERGEEIERLKAELSDLQSAKKEEMASLEARLSRLESSLNKTGKDSGIESSSERD